MKKRIVAKTSSIPVSKLRRLASVVLKRVELHGINLWEFSGRHTLPVLTPARYHINLDINANAQQQKRDGASFLMMRIEFGVTATKADPGSDGELIEVKASFAVQYNVSPGGEFSEEQMDAFMRLVAIMNVWPYLRECVQSVTSKMGIPPIVLPLYKPAPDGSPSLLSMGSRAMIEDGSRKGLPKKKAPKKVGKR